VRTVGVCWWCDGCRRAYALVALLALLLVVGCGDVAPAQVDAGAGGASSGGAGGTSGAGGAGGCIDANAPGFHLDGFCGLVENTCCSLNGSLYVGCVSGTDAASFCVAICAQCYDGGS